MVELTLSASVVGLTAGLILWPVSQQGSRVDLWLITIDLYLIVIHIKKLQIDACFSLHHLNTGLFKVLSFLFYCFSHSGAAAT